MSNKGKKVKVHYTGTLDDGTKFDSSVDRGEPIEFVCMAGQMIPGFEQAVLNHEKGDAFTATIPAAEAYGVRDEELLFKVPRAQVPSNIMPEPGMLLHVSTDQGELEVGVAAVDDQAITLDANHPLAGQDLTFALTIVDVR